MFGTAASILARKKRAKKKVAKKKVLRKARKAQAGTTGLGSKLVKSGVKKKKVKKKLRKTLKKRRKAMDTLAENPALNEARGISLGGSKTAKKKKPVNKTPRWARDRTRGGTSTSSLVQQVDKNTPNIRQKRKK